MAKYPPRTGEPPRSGFTLSEMAGSFMAKGAEGAAKAQEARWSGINAETLPVVKDAIVTYLEDPDSYKGMASGVVGAPADIAGVAFYLAKNAYLYANEKPLDWPDDFAHIPFSSEHFGEMLGADISKATFLIGTAITLDPTDAAKFTNWALRASKALNGSRAGAYKNMTSAERMYNDGVDPDVIYASTGWRRDTEGNFKFFLSDVDSQVRIYSDLTQVDNVIKDAMIEFPESITGFKFQDFIIQRQNMISKFSEGPLSWNFKSEESAIVDFMTHYGSGYVTLPLHKVWTHDALFELYPHLRDIKITVPVARDKQGLWNFTDNIRDNALLRYLVSGPAPLPGTGSAGYFRSSQMAEDVIKSNWGDLPIENRPIAPAQEVVIQRPRPDILMPGRTDRIKRDPRTQSYDVASSKLGRGVPYSLNSIILHEVQHALQHHDDFTRGFQEQSRHAATYSREPPRTTQRQAFSTRYEARTLMKFTEYKKDLMLRELLQDFTPFENVPTDDIIEMIYGPIKSSKNDTDWKWWKEINEDEWLDINSLLGTSDQIPLDPINMAETIDVLRKAHQVGEELPDVPILIQHLSTKLITDAENISSEWSQLFSALKDNPQGATRFVDAFSQPVGNLNGPEILSQMLYWFSIDEMEARATQIIASAQKYQRAQGVPITEIEDTEQAILRAVFNWKQIEKMEQQGVVPKGMYLTQRKMESGDLPPEVPSPVQTGDEFPKQSSEENAKKVFEIMMGKSAPTQWTQEEITEFTLRLNTLLEDVPNL